MKSAWLARASKPVTHWDRSVDCRNCFKTMHVGKSEAAGGIDVSVHATFFAAKSAGKANRSPKKDEIWFYRLLRRINILVNTGIIMAKSGLLIPILGIVIPNPLAIG